MAELRRLAAPCDFRDFLNNALRDRLVCRLHNEGAQKRLLSEADLSLTKALTIAQSMEAAEIKPRTPKSSSSSPRKACYCCGKNNHLHKSTINDALEIDQYPLPRPVLMICLLPCLEENSLLF